MPIEIVETKKGKLKGVLQEYEDITMSVFKGIPYAKPPIKELRFHAPQEIEPWEGIKICDTYGDAPIQEFEDMKAGSVIWTSREFNYKKEYPKMSEDCLYLNVYTAAEKQDEKRPVLIWFHGGGLMNGYAYEPTLDPSEFVRRGIVVVQIGTRLNVFGFLSLPQLSKEQGHSGNYGLMDELMALDWVSDNISLFGGDPNNITAGGESGGCTKASVLAAIPASKFRVRRIINQSGNQWLRTFLNQKEAEERGRNYLKEIGLDPDISLEELRSLPYEKLFDPNVDRFKIPTEIIKDNYLASEDLMECFDKYMENVDVLNGSNDGEADVFGLQWWEYDELIDNKDKFEYFYHGLLGKLYDKYDFQNAVPYDEEKPWNQARHLASEGLCICTPGNASRSLMINRLFGAYFKKRYPHNKVYSYLWSHILPYHQEDVGTYFDPDKMLSYHGSDLWYVFHTLKDGVPPVRPWTEKDYKLADQISQYWTNFIATGDPNGEDLPYWPASDENYGYMKFTDEPEGHSGLENKKDRMIKEFTVREYKLKDY